MRSHGLGFPGFGPNPVVKLLYLPLGLIPLPLFSYYVVEGPSRRSLRRMFDRLHAR